MPKRRFGTRGIVTIALACVLGALAVGGTIAWLVQHDEKENAFGMGEVQVVVNEEFNDPYTVKQNVYVTNEGTVPAYVRAQVNIYWVDANGNQLWEEPKAGTDYTIEGGLPAGDGWAQGTDGLYYWKTPLQPKDLMETVGTTRNLINRIEQTDEQRAKYADGRKLVVDITVQSIQYEPAVVLREAWGVTVVTDANGNASLQTNADGNVVVTLNDASAGSTATTAEGEE